MLKKKSISLYKANLPVCYYSNYNGIPPCCSALRSGGGGRPVSGSASPSLHIKCHLGARGHYGDGDTSPYYCSQHKNDLKLADAQQHFSLCHRNLVQSLYDGPPACPFSPVCQRPCVSCFLILESDCF